MDRKPHENEKEINLKNVVVQFELPYVLRVVDSIKKETQSDGYNDYIFPINGIPAMLRFEKKLKRHGRMSIATEDRRGQLSCSIVQVWFDKQFFKAYNVPKEYKKCSHLFMQASIAYVNRFTGKYAEATSSFWIYPLNVSDIPMFNLMGRYTDGKDDPFHQGTLGTGVGLGKVVTPEQDKKIRDDLLNGELVDNLQRLSFTARNYLETSDYWLACLTIEILFETKFARMLNNAFTNEGLTDSEIENKFKYSDGRSRSITNLLKTYVTELCGIDIDNVSCEFNQEYIDWCNDARDLRNEIAHGKTLSVSKDKAIRAFTSVKKLLTAIEKKLPDTATTEILIP
ncbi:hypothetical protein JYU16_01100 [bacterium AH-315-M05]|nr:hypothetical protein [bacterium AH-315-M05]